VETGHTLQLVYSAAKAACTHLLAQRGELDLDQPAATARLGELWRSTCSAAP